MRWIFLVLLIFIGCGSSGSDNKENLKIDINKTFYWQLTGEINTTKKANIYDIDLFDSNKTLINKLKLKGKIVICYFSAGSYEDWREDANKFPQEAIGEKMEGWDERWVDIRNKTIREIMKLRMDLAKSLKLIKPNKPCIICGMESLVNEKNTMPLCRNHYKALLNLRETYWEWVKAFGKLSFHEYLQKISRLSISGKWVREVAESILKGKLILQ